MVMRSRLLMASRGLAVSGVAVGALAMGCASILSIPDRTLASVSDGGTEHLPDGTLDARDSGLPDSGFADSGSPDSASPDSLEWCDRPENKHDFCEDFDHDDAGTGWAAGATNGATYSFVPSTDSPPTALDLSTTPQALGATSVGGLYMPFTQPFGHVHFAVDVRFRNLDLESEGGLSAQLGFLLLEQTGFCIGMVMTPAGMGIVMRAKTTDCTGVMNVPVGVSPIIDDAGLSAFQIVAPVPTLNQDTWSHISLDVKRNSDGSGAVDFGVNYPGRVEPPQIPPGYLTADPPAIAVATSVVGPSGTIDLQFDNVTVDFLAD
jgi:hypothetical protein